MNGTHGAIVYATEGSAGLSGAEQPCILNFIRHGATAANEKRIYCGFTDIPLSEAGREGLRLLRSNLVYPASDIYITSGMKRADETLKILFDKDPDYVIREFREFNFGDFEMKAHGELCSAADYIRWIESGCETVCPGGESRADFKSRLLAGLTRLARLNARSAIIVCHGGVISEIMAYLFPEEKRHFYEWQPGFGRGYTVEIMRNNKDGCKTGFVDRALFYREI